MDGYGEVHAELMDTFEAARALRLSPLRVRRFAEAGRLPAIKIGRKWYFKKPVLEAWLEGGDVTV